MTVEHKNGVFVREINPDELKELNRLKDLRSSKLRERVLIILHSHHGKTVSGIRNSLQLDCDVIRRWIHRFNQYGLKGIEVHKPKGSEKKFTPEIRKQIAEIASCKPRKLGLLDFEYWSLQKLADYLTEEEVVKRISIETLSNILFEEKVKLKKPAKKKPKVSQLEE